jgi:hypothetical protein
MFEAVSTNISVQVANNALEAWLCVRLQLCSALLVGGLAFSAMTFHVLASKGAHNLRVDSCFAHCFAHALSALAVTCSPGLCTQRVHDPLHCANAHATFTFPLMVVMVLNAGSVNTQNWAVLLTGLGLAYALPLVSLLSSTLTASAKVEQDLVAVERILQFINIPAAHDGGLLDEDTSSTVLPLFDSLPPLETSWHICGGRVSMATAVALDATIQKM